MSLLGSTPRSLAGGASEPSTGSSSDPDWPTEGAPTVDLDALQEEDDPSPSQRFLALFHRVTDRELAEMAATAAAVQPLAAARSRSCPHRLSPRAHRKRTSLRKQRKTPVKTREMTATTSPRNRLSPSCLHHGQSQPLRPTSLMLMNVLLFPPPWRATTACSPF